MLVQIVETAYLLPRHQRIHGGNLFQEKPLDVTSGSDR